LNNIVDEYWQFPVMEFYMVGKISINMLPLSAYFIITLTCRNDNRKLGTWMHSSYFSTENEMYVNSKPEKRMWKNE